jgi:hypothetical protein
MEGNIPSIKGTVNAELLKIGGIGKIVEIRVNTQPRIESSGFNAKVLLPITGQIWYLQSCYISFRSLLQ